MRMTPSGSARISADGRFRKVVAKDPACEQAPADICLLERASHKQRPVAGGEQDRTIPSDVEGVVELLKIRHVHGCQHDAGKAAVLVVDAP
jgi:hypothetical protein